MTLAHELEVVLELAQSAGEILLEIYATDFDVAYKGKSNPVTVADTRANAFLVSELHKHFPDDGIMAEESVDDAKASRSGRIWFVDPLDGTKEFIAKNGEFSVMLGLAIGGSSKLGVVHQPALKRTWWGIADARKCGVRDDGGETLLSLDARERPISECTLVVSRSHRSAIISMRFARRQALKKKKRAGRWVSKLG